SQLVPWVLKSPRCHDLPVLVVAPDVVAFVEHTGRKHQADSAAVEVDLVGPKPHGHIEAAPRSRKMHDLTSRAIVENDVEGPGKARDDLLLLAMCMGAAALTGRHVIEVEHASDGERYVSFALDGCQAAVRIGELLELYP